MAGCSDGTATPDDAGPGEGSTDASVEVTCAANLKQHGAACIPVLDDCKRGEVPVPGGGCKRVGVESCSGGLKGPQDTTCTPVGVVECSGGLKGPTDKTCTAVGVEACSGGLKSPSDASCTAVGPSTACPGGWAKTSKGWCEPVLPSGSCAAGTLEVMGFTSCQPIGDCGSGTYGKIQTGSQTLFVDQAYTGGGSDGTPSKPFTTIGAAVKAAAAGAQLAVAAGTYQEDLALSQPLTVEGRCAQKVVIKGQSASGAVVAASAKVTLRGLSVTGPGAGIQVTGAGADALVERVEVGPCGATGLVVDKGAKVALKHALVRASHGAGVEVSGATAVLSQAVVRDTESDATTQLGGEGILAAAAGSAGATLTLADCVIAGNRNAGLSLEGTTATLDRVVISGTRPRLKDTTGGAGILADGAQAKLTLRHGLVASNQHPGLALLGAQATLEDTVVRDTRSRDLDQQGGDGIQAVFGSAGPAKLTLKRCLLHGNRNIAVTVAGSEVTLERTVVQNTLPQAKDNKYGIGLQAGLGLGGEPRSKVALTECIFASNSYEGLIFFGAEATLKRTIVRDTAADAGLVAKAMGSQQAELKLSDCLVDGNRRAGVQLEESKALLERTVIQQTEAWSDKAYGVGLWAIGAEVTLKECLVTGNRLHGVSLRGTRATLERSVVRDTRSQLSDNSGGFGIAAMAYAGKGSELTLKSSLVSNNRAIGVQLDSSTGTLERTVVRDTRPKASTRTYGDGIQIIRGSNGPSKLTLKECLVANNRNAGLSVYGSSATLERTIVRDTRPRDSDQQGIAGIEARAWPKEPAELTLRDSVVSNNRGAGVQVCGSTAKLERSVVRDTLPSAADGTLGHGVVIRRLGDRSSTATLTECAVVNNRSAGLTVLASSATLDRTVVRETQPRAADGKLGIGVQASLLPDGAGKWSGSPSSLTLRDSLVASNRATGITVASSGATIQRCIVRDTRVDLASGGYGDGIQAAPHRTKDKVSLEIADSLVASSARSGVLYVAAGGSVRRTVLREGVFAIVVDRGADPEIGADNVYEKNNQNKVAYGQGLTPAPVAGVPPSS